MSKETIIEAVRALAKDVDLDPQGRYDMLAEIADVVSDESDTLFVENDIEDDADDEDEWEPVDEYDEGDDFDDDEEEDDYR